jgi:hypothetical protein
MGIFSEMEDFEKYIKTRIDDINNNIFIYINYDKEL